MDYGAIDTLGLVFSAYLDDLGYLPTFRFVLRHFTLDTFMLSILPELDHYLLLSHTSHHDLTPLFRLGENVDQSSISLIVLSYIFWTLSSSSSMKTRPNRLLIYW